VVREYTVLDFVDLVRKLDRFWIGLRDGNLKITRDGPHSDGYKNTISYHFYKDISQLSGSVPVTYHNAENGIIIAGRGKSSVVNDVWDVFKNSINEVNKEMKYLLTSSFGVKDVDKFYKCYLHSLDNPYNML